MIKTFLCHLSPFTDIKSLQGLLKVSAECDDKDIKTFLCHLSPFSDIKSLQGLLKVMAECDDKDISVPSISLK